MVWGGKIIPSQRKAGRCGKALLDSTGQLHRTINLPRVSVKTRPLIRAAAYRSALFFKLFEGGEKLALAAGIRVVVAGRLRKFQGN